MPNNNSKSEAVVVVGGGLSGLAVAAYLARSGRSVTLFEKAHETGGRAITNEYSGFRFNRGPHALYRKGPAEQVLQELGVRYSGNCPPGNGFMLYRGQLHLLPADTLSLIKTRLLGFGDKLRLAWVFGRLGFLKEASFAGITFEDWLNKTFASEAGRQVMYSFNRTLTYTNAPEIQSADQFILQGRQAFKHGVMYLDGGWQTLVDGLREAAQAAGVKIVTGQRVEAVEGEEEVEGVRLASGEFYPAGVVVIAASPADASHLLRQGGHPALRKWAELAQPARAACLDLALRRLPEPGRLFVMGVDSPIYYSVHSSYARLGPQGKVVLQVANYLRPDETPGARQDEQELEAFLDKIQPGWQAEVLERRFLPHMIVNNAIPQAGQGGLAGRPGVKVPGIQGLYLAGDWVGPQGLLLDAGLASARQAAHLIISQPAQEREEFFGKQPARSL